MSLRVHHEPTSFEGARPGESASGAVQIDVAVLAALRDAGTVGNHDLFMFALAGESAENVVLGHETPYGAAKDVREFWAWTKGQTFTSMHEYEEVLGEPFDAARQRVGRWARERAGEIERLALRLEARGSVTVSEARSIAGRSPI